VRDSATIGVEQNRPMSTPGVAKCAASEAIARSQLATSWQPAAVAMPWTDATTGLGRCTIACIIALQAVIISAKKARPRSGSARRAVSSFMSWPAEKAGPLAAITTPRTVLSSRISLSSACRLAIIAADRLLRAVGRLRVRTAIGPTVSRSRIGSCGEGARAAWTDIKAFPVGLLRLDDADNLM
jgi:hypothetical protein